MGETFEPAERIWAYTNGRGLRVWTPMMPALAGVHEEQEYVHSDVHATLARQAEALQRENAEKDVQIERLEADLEEARDVPWPDWARTILKTLQQYGYDPVIDGEVDLGEAFKDYLEGVSQSEKEQVARTREALRPFARLATEFSHEPDDWKIWGLNNADLTYGDFRRARALVGGSDAE